MTEPEITVVRSAEGVRITVVVTERTTVIVRTAEQDAFTAPPDPVKRFHAPEPPITLDHVRPPVDLAASQAAQFPKPPLVSQEDRETVTARNRYLTTTEQTAEVQEFRAAFRRAMTEKGCRTWGDLWAFEPNGPAFIEVVGALGLMRAPDGLFAEVPLHSDPRDPDNAIGRGTTTMAEASVPEGGYTPLSREQREELEEAFQKAILRDGDSGPINDLIQKTIEGWGFTRGKGGSAWEMFVARGGAWHGQLLAAVHGMGASTADEADRTGRTAAPALEPKPAPSAPDWYLRKTPTQHESTLSDDCGDGTRFMVDRQNQEAQWTIWRVRQDGAEMTVMGQKHRTFNAAVKKMNELVQTQVAVLQANAR